jgi:hypothetical protein
MTDIVDRLTAALMEQEELVVPHSLIVDAIVEIKNLRSLAGKATVGPSFAEIAKDLPRRSNEQSHTINDPGCTHPVASTHSTGVLIRDA